VHSENVAEPLVSGVYLYHASGVESDVPHVVEPSTVIPVVLPV
jgi:hypothetical protein